MYVVCVVSVLCVVCMICVVSKSAIKVTPTARGTEGWVFRRAWYLRE